MVQFFYVLGNTWAKAFIELERDEQGELYGDTACGLFVSEQPSRRPALSSSLELGGPSMKWESANKISSKGDRSN